MCSAAIQPPELEKGKNKGNPSERLNYDTLITKVQVIPHNEWIKLDIYPFRIRSIIVDTSSRIPDAHFNMKAQTPSRDVNSVNVVWPGTRDLEQQRGRYLNRST